MNCSDRLLTLIAESKALLRLGVAIPEPARVVLEQVWRLQYLLRGGEGREGRGGEGKGGREGEGRDGMVSV